MHTGNRSLVKLLNVTFQNLSRNIHKKRVKTAVTLWPVTSHDGVTELKILSFLGNK